MMILQCRMWRDESQKKHQKMTIFRPHFWPQKSTKKASKTGPKGWETRSEKKHRASLIGDAECVNSCVDVRCWTIKKYFSQMNQSWEFSRGVSRRDAMRSRAWCGAYSHEWQVSHTCVTWKQAWSSERDHAGIKKILSKDLLMRSFMGSHTTSSYLHTSDPKNFYMSDDVV